MELAVVIGVSQAAVSAWEAGGSLNLRLQTFLRSYAYSMPLGVPQPEYLIRGTDW